MTADTKVLNQKPLKKSELVSYLANYNLPKFVLEKVASKCESELAKKGKIIAILDSMNEAALTLLYKIFVKCEDDEEGEFSDYRFGVFISSKVHSKIMFDQPLTGGSGTEYKVKMVVFGNQGLNAVGENKSKGGKVTVDELKRFNKMVKDISKSKDGLNLLSAFYGSSSGYEKDFNKAFVGNTRTKTPVNKYGYSIPKTITLLEFRDKNTNKIFTASF
ncbi:MAG: hypothetical protein EX285_02230 [Thaumarchaeota archaeon]|nr:hypothetical protein [Nitrososphaerota archaeon]